MRQVFTGRPKRTFDFDLRLRRCLFQMRLLAVVVVAVAAALYSASNTSVHYRTVTSQSLHYFSRPHVGVHLHPIASAAAWRGSDLNEAGGACHGCQWVGVWGWVLHCHQHLSSPPKVILIIIGVCMCV